ncbi:hypothetical protein ACK3ZH_11505, partial [Aeromonas caviae]
MGLVTVVMASELIAWKIRGCIQPPPLKLISTQCGIQRHHQGKAGHQVWEEMGLVTVVMASELIAWKIRGCIQP